MLVKENNYSKYFKKQLLNEDDQFPTDDENSVSPSEAPSDDMDVKDVPDSSEEQAWKQSLDTETDPSKFDVKDNPRIEMSKQAMEMGKEWVETVAGFKSWINSMERGSLNMEITENDRDGSIFKGIVRSQSRRITKIAEELAALEEVLKGYIIQAPKKEREINKQLGGM